MRYSGNSVVPWENRRYLTLLLPLLLLGIGYVASLMARRRGIVLKVVAVCLVLAVFISFLPMDAGLAKQTVYSGIGRQLAAVAADLPEGTVVMGGKTIPNIIGIPLRYQYDADFYWLQEMDAGRLNALATLYQSRGEALYIAVASPDEVYGLSPGVSFLPTDRSYVLSSPMMLQGVGMRPGTWRPLVITIRLLAVKPGYSVSAAPGASFTINTQAKDSTAGLGYLDRFIYQKKADGTYNCWLVGVKPADLQSLLSGDQGVFDRLSAAHPGLSRVRVPFVKSGSSIEVAVRTTSVAESGGAGILVNGLPAKGVRVTRSGRVVTSKFVITPDMQKGPFQEITLVGQASGGNSPMSGVNLISLEADVAR
jgi:hypothetical protein